MLRTSYLFKLLLLLLALVILLEVTSYGATRIVIREAVAANARSELLRGGEVFSQLMQSRAEQLALSVNVLTDDFGFREAVSSGDAETIRSALVNHSARVDADVGMVFDRSGELVASTVDLPEQSDQRLADLQVESARNGSAYASVILNNKPYQFVLSSVRAPLMIGLAGMGFEIEENFTTALKRLTGLEVSFIRISAQNAEYLSGTLDTGTRVLLINDLRNNTWQENNVWQIGGMMTLVVQVAQEQDGLVAVLQVPLTQVLAPFERLDSQLLWLALLFSLFAAILAIFLARTVTKPVISLADIAKKIGAGDYATPIAVKSNDEFGDLGNAFVRMQAAIGEREQQIIEQSQQDPLTKLANRSRVVPQLESAISRAKHSSLSFSLLLVDIRNFTQINDELTPEIADQVLYEVAQRLVKMPSRNELVLRLGSDEFLVIVNECDEKCALLLADTIHQIFTLPVNPGGLSVKIDLNIGLVSYPGHGDTPEVLLRRANLALNHGRMDKQQTSAYQHGWDEVHLRRLSLLREFKQALNTRQISLYYQPKLDIADARQSGAEALVRWQHPQMGFINPEEFVSVIESAGQITALTRWVIDTAIQHLRRLLDENISLTLSVNLSALDLLVDDLPDYIQSLLQQYQVPAHHLCLEITESAIMREADKSLSNLNRLKLLGMSLSIDDFGTGYSSLSQLKKLPVSELKIDKSFILNLDTSEDDQLIVRSTIELGHTMGMSITAEGVESAEILQLLAGFGCDTAQGFFYCKPVPADEFIVWTKNYQMSLANE